MDIDISTFSRTLAHLLNCPNGMVFEQWLREQLTVSTYDDNALRMAHSEGERSAYRRILHFVEQGRTPTSYPEEAQG